MNTRSGISSGRSPTSSTAAANTIRHVGAIRASTINHDRDGLASRNNSDKNEFIQKDEKERECFSYDAAEKNRGFRRDESSENILHQTVKRHCRATYMNQMYFYFSDAMAYAATNSSSPFMQPNTNVSSPLTSNSLCKLCSDQKKLLFTYEEVFQSLTTPKGNAQCPTGMAKIKFVDREQMWQWHVEHWEKEFDREWAQGLHRLWTGGIIPSGFLWEFLM